MPDSYKKIFDGNVEKIIKAFNEKKINVEALSSIIINSFKNKSTTSFDKLREELGFPINLHENERQIAYFAMCCVIFSKSQHEDLKQLGKTWLTTSDRKIFMLDDELSFLLRNLTSEQFIVFCKAIETSPFLTDFTFDDLSGGIFSNFHNSNIELLLNAIRDNSHISTFSFKALDLKSWSMFSYETFLELIEKKESLAILNLFWLRVSDDPLNKERYNQLLTIIRKAPALSEFFVSLDIDVQIFNDKNDFHQVETLLNTVEKSQIHVFGFVCPYSMFNKKNNNEKNINALCKMIANSNLVYLELASNRDFENFDSEQCKKINDAIHKNNTLKEFSGIDALPDKKIVDMIHEKLYQNIWEEKYHNAFVFLGKNKIDQAVKLWLKIPSNSSRYFSARSHVFEVVYLNYRDTSDLKSHSAFISALPLLCNDHIFIFLNNISAGKENIDSQKIIDGFLLSTAGIKGLDLALTPEKRVALLQYIFLMHFKDVFDTQKDNLSILGKRGFFSLEDDSKILHYVLNDGFSKIPTISSVDELFNEDNKSAIHNMLVLIKKDANKLIKEFFPETEDDPMCQQNMEDILETILSMTESQQKIIRQP